MRLWLKELLLKQQEEHKRRMLDVHCTVDNKRSHDNSYVRNRSRERSKKNAMIEEQNRSVLDRLGRAMNSKKIDNNPPRHHIESVGDAKRRKQLNKITEENTRMLRRIQSIEPHYNRMKWEVENYENERIIRTISEFPDAYNRPSSNMISDRFEAAGPSLPSLSTHRSRSIQHHVLPPTQILKRPGTAPSSSKSSSTHSQRRREPYDIAQPALDIGMMEIRASTDMDT